jgi:hypothetical protein
VAMQEDGGRIKAAGFQPPLTFPRRNGFVLN